MKLAVWLAACALSLAAQPKLLVNAAVDTRSAAAGLEPVFQALVAAQAQPAWIGYSVPAAQGVSLGCEVVSPGGWYAPGVVHLEPPAEMVLLFRIEGNAVKRIQKLSPDCEIDAGGLPVRWLTDVGPAQSVALLAGLAQSGENPGAAAISAIGLHADPSAIPSLESFTGRGRPDWLRRRAVSALSRSKDPRAAAVLESLLKR